MTCFFAPAYGSARVRKLASTSILAVYWGIIVVGPLSAPALAETAVFVKTDSATQGKGTVAGFAAMAQGQALSGVRPYNCARNFYVDGTTGNDVGTSGSQSYPWKTIQYANNSGVLLAGDCVYVAPGTYLQSPLYLTNRGSANMVSSYVTYIGAPNNATTLTVSPGTFAVELIATNYIILDGFNIDWTVAADYAGGNIGTAHHLIVLKGIPKSSFK